MNKAMIESYLRNLLGQIIGAATIVSQTSDVAVTSFGSSEWLLVANALWASLVPVVIRYAKKSDPAFGLVAEQVTAEVTKKISTTAAAKKKAPAKKK
jgi:hypothetical protein